MSPVLIVKGSKNKIFKGRTPQKGMSNEMSIEEVKRKYKNEWVLVEIVEEDTVHGPTRVKLITHSENRDEVYEVLGGTKEYTSPVYTGDPPRKGYVVAFYG
jgi:hypothetical protein